MEDKKADERVVRAIDRIGPELTLGDIILELGNYEGGATALRAALVVVAHQAGADIHPAPNGEVVYTFPANLRSVLRQRSRSSLLRGVLSRLWRWLCFASRMAFGFMLVASIVLVAISVIIIMIILLSQGGGQRGGRNNGPVLPIGGGGGGPGGGGGGGGGHYHHGYNPWLGLYWRDWILLSMMDEDRRRWDRVHGHHHVRRPEAAVPTGKGGGGGSGAGPPGGGGDPGAGGGNGPPPPVDPTLRGRGPDDLDPEGGGERREMTFFESVYCFVFGLGDANADLEARRWRAIGLLLRQNEGVVFAEQVAPFLDTWLLHGQDAPAEAGLADGVRRILRRLRIPLLRGRARAGGDRPREESRMHEGYMLPVLAQLGGHAESSDDGRLVYVFPSLQVSTRPADAPSSSRQASARPAGEGVPPPVPPPIYERLQVTFNDAGDKQGFVIALGVANALLLLVFKKIGGLDFAKLAAEAKNGARPSGRHGRKMGPHRPEGDEGDVLELLAFVPQVTARLFWPLAIYAASFFVIPAVRALLAVWKNKRITARNAIRRSRVADAVAAAAEAEALKGAQARQHRELTILERRPAEEP